MKMVSEEQQYAINNHHSAALVFKVAMNKAIVDTRATASHFRTNLASLDAYMSSVNSDIDKFNLYVKQAVRGLKARRERTDDLMIYLFKGYKTATNEEFVKYITQKEQSYNEGSDLTYEQLMTFAHNDFENSKRNGIWGSKTPDQRQIVALQSSLNKVKKDNIQLRADLKSKIRGKNEKKSTKANDKKIKGNQIKEQEEKE